MGWHIAVVDDEVKACDEMVSRVKLWGTRMGYSCRVCVFPSAEALIFAMEEEPFDILLLDVELGGMSGLELAREIRKSNHRVEIIFVTSHFELTGSGYEVDALHYLVKPVSEGKLESVLAKAAERLSEKPSMVTLMAEGSLLRIPADEIIYVEAFLHYVEVHTRGRNYRVKEAMSAFAEKLSPDFFRTHRSYLVNLTHIVRIDRTGVTVECGTKIPLARGKYDEVNRAFIERN